MLSMLSRTVILKRPLYGDTDRYGNDAPRYDDPTSQTEARAWIAPTTDTEATDDKQRRVSEVLLYFRSDVEIEADFRVELDGLEYEVVGEPQRFHTPRGLHHIEVSGRLVQG